MIPGVTGQRLFGRYQLLRRLAAGGMGEVHLARLVGPAGFEKLLVLKRLLPNVANNENFVRMFFSEAKLAAKLTHKNIVQIFEMGHTDDAYFLAMEYVQGKTLRDILSRACPLQHTLPPAHIAEIGFQICDGLAYAHAMRDVDGKPLGLVHRDISPRNILISYSGEVKLIDFGIAKSKLSDVATQRGTIKGKLGYMSPEQATGRPLDNRSDMFSVGICLYEMCTDRNPFAREDPALTYDAIQRHEPPPMSQLAPQAKPLEPIVMRALAKEPAERYADCAEMRDILRRTMMSGALPLAESTLAAWVSRLFADAVAEDDRWLQEVVATAAPPAFMTPPPSFNTPPPAFHSSAVLEIAVEPPAASSPRTLFGLRPRFAAALAIIAAVTAGGSALLHATATERGLTQRTVVEPIDAVPHGAAEVVNLDSQRVSDSMTSGKAGSEPGREPTRPDDEELAPARPLEPEQTAAPSQSKTAAAKPKTPPPKAKTPPKAPPPRSKAQPAIGKLNIVTSPAVPVLYRGSQAGRTIRLRAASGILEVGTGGDATTDPFAVKIRYRIEGGTMLYKLHSTPRAIIFDDQGVYLSKTPYEVRSGRGATILNLRTPKRLLKLGLHFSR